ncbi:hypothetical protein HY636_00935 [Candidatus Woesearchaeota archaeon]|nr:hypothetical protein [Candidatus Woesearchaeota archaeon]
MVSEELVSRVNGAFEEFQRAEQLDRPHFLETRKRITSGFSAEEWKLFLGRWVSANFEIPELASKEDLFDSLSEDVCSFLGVASTSLNQILGLAFEGVGVLNDEKCRILINKKKVRTTKSVSYALFHGENAEFNAKYYIRYLWENKWKYEKKQIPELLTKIDLNEYVTAGVYYALGFKNNNVAKLLVATIENYGVLDNEKCRVFAAQTDRSSQTIILSNAFFTGKHAKQHAEDNAKCFVRYLWTHSLKNDETPIPELLKKDYPFCEGVYTALGLKTSNTNKALRMSIENYGVLDDEKCALYISRKDIGSRGTLSYVFFSDKDAKPHVKDNAKCLVKYAWEHHWKTEQTPIPELLKRSDVLGLLGVGAYRALGVKQGQYTKILNFSIDGFGILDDEKCRVYISRSDKDIRRTLSITFFTGEEAKQYAKANVTYLVRYAWAHHWKSDDKPIPECVDSTMVKKLLGGGVYPALGIEMEHHSELLRATIENYGKLDDGKCEVLANQKDVGLLRTLSYAFFSGDNARSNAEYFIRYLWKNKWRSDKTPIPELINIVDMDKYNVGYGVYTALGLGEGNLVKLLRLIFEDFGVLDDEKAKACLDVFNPSNNISHNIKTKLREIFFYEENKSAEENKQKLLTAYQQIHQKRLSDLGKEDYKMLPPEVCELITPAVKGAISPTIISPRRNEAGYHQIHVEWTSPMTQHLQELYETHGNALFRMRDILWSALGITSFSAMMKASELGLIALITFGNSLSSRMPHYNFVHFNGYQTFREMAEKAERIETLDEIDAECFITPANKQGIHVQIPITFKGINLTGYTDVEQQALRTIATFIYNPNLFKRENDIRGLPYFSAVSELVEPYCIVPVIQSETIDSITEMIADTTTGNNGTRTNSDGNDNESLVKLYLPTNHCRDFGGIFSSVLNMGSKNIFLFRHYDVGCIE